MIRILVTNDDGVFAPGLRALEEALGQAGEVYTVAPAAEFSGSSRAITLRQPLRFAEAGPRRYAVEGTPADSVMMGVNQILDFRPDLAVSGVNAGPNLGENIFYSGTVAAAAEAAKYNIPAIAVSVTERRAPDFRPAARFAAALARRVLAEGLPEGVALNVNVPHPRFRGVEITRQSHKISRNIMLERRDPRGRPYYWMHEEVPIEEAEPGSDYAAVREGRVSITPLRLDPTAHDLIPALSGWAGDIEEETSRAELQSQRRG